MQRKTGRVIKKEREIASHKQTHIDRRGHREIPNRMTEFGEDLRARHHQMEAKQSNRQEGRKAIVSEVITVASEYTRFDG